MLIRFRVQNFLSFKEEVELSMIPGKTRQHAGHILSTGDNRHDIDLLRVGVVYGANASGKSNLVKAVSFARDLVVEGTKARQSIAVKPFKLDRSCATQPSKFEFEIRQHNRNYLYGFEIDAHRVQAEWLYEIKKTTQSLVFERRTADGDETSVEWGKLNYQDKEERSFLQFVARGTRPNQLFLTESIDRNVKRFEDVYQWFKRVLTIVFPETRYEIKLHEQTNETQAIVSYLDVFGTGVCGYDLQPVSPENEFPSILLETLTKTIEAGQSINLLNAQGQRYQVAKTEQQELVTVKLVLKHKMSDCDEAFPMDMSEESDGTVRLLDLIPMLTLSEQTTRVFLVDELDRSLHPALCHELVERFLGRPVNSQLIVTTHESNLLNFDLLRRDEVWFVEKNELGASALYSLEEFTPRYDKDIQKGYLLGRFGAIPMVSQTPFYEAR